MWCHEDEDPWMVDDSLAQVKYYDLTRWWVENCRVEPSEYSIFLVIKIVEGAGQQYIVGMLIWWYD
jgi:hypothetical protein